MFKYVFSLSQNTVSNFFIEGLLDSGVRLHVQLVDNGDASIVIVFFY